jgi:hypothetical protein
MKEAIGEGTSGQVATLDVHNYAVKVTLDIIGDGSVFAFNHLGSWLM